MTVLQSHYIEDLQRPVLRSCLLVFVLESLVRCLQTLESGQDLVWFSLIKPQTLKFSEDRGFLIIIV